MLNGLIQTNYLKMNKKDFDIINAKEILTVKEIAILLNCSVKTVYRYINKGHIKAVNLGNRLTRIKKSTLDGLFDKP